MGRRVGQVPDAVQVKVTLAGRDLDDARIAFDLADPTARRSRVYFCEEPAVAGQLALFDAGLILRLQETDRDAHEAVVVLRPCPPGRLPRRWVGAARPAGVRIEAEWTPQDRTCSVSAAGDVAAPAFATAVGTRAGVPAALSSLQRAFLAECSPTQPRFDVLHALGPVEMLTWSRDVEDLHIVATLWSLRPAAPLLLELSVRTDPQEAPLVQPVLVGLVRGRGLDPEAFTGTKTRVVLSWLAGAGRLPRPGAAP